MTPRPADTPDRTPWLDGWWVALLSLATAALLATDFDHAHWLTAARERIGAGELWRLFTGALVAENTHRLAADLLVLALAGALLGAGWSRRRAGLLLATLAVPTALALVLQPGATAHYGLAGTTLTLLVLGAATRARQRNGWLVTPAALALGLALHALLPLATARCNDAMVLAAHRAGGKPYALSTPLPRLTCGPRALCWYVEHQLHQPCDHLDVARRIWSPTEGTRIDAFARELTRRAGQPYVAARLPPGELPCVARCQPPIALVDVGWLGPKSHFVVVHRAAGGWLTWYDVNRGHRRAPAAVFARAWRTYDYGAVVARRCLHRCRSRLTPAAPLGR